MLPAEEGDIKLATLQVVGQRSGVIARNPNLDIQQLVMQDADGARQPNEFLADLETDGKSRFGRLGGAPRRLRGCRRLSERQPRMIQKGAPGCG